MCLLRRMGRSCFSFYPFLYTCFLFRYAILPGLIGSFQSFHTTIISTLLLRLFSHFEPTITKRRNADSVLTNEDGSLSFVKPYERNETFRDLITYIQDQEKASSSTSLGPTKYGQTRKWSTPPHLISSSILLHHLYILHGTVNSISIHTLPDC